MQHAAAAFAHVGLRSGDVVAQFSDNSSRWLLADQVRYSVWLVLILAPNRDVSVASRGRLYFRHRSAWAGAFQSSILHKASIKVAAHAFVQQLWYKSIITSTHLRAVQGIMMNGGINAVRSGNTSLEELIGILETSRASGLVVQDPTVLHKLAPALRKLRSAKLRYVVVLWDDVTSEQKKAIRAPVYSFEEVRMPSIASTQYEHCCSRCQVPYGVLMRLLYCTSCTALHWWRTSQLQCCCHRCIWCSSNPSASVTWPVGSGDRRSSVSTGAWWPRWCSPVAPPARPRPPR